MSANEQLITLTADIVSSHLANNSVAVGDVPNLIQQVHRALAGLGAPVEDTVQEKTPVVSVRASLKPDYIVCMECGAKQKMLKRHLQTAHGMTPDQYRTDYGLPREYPMVAANYSEQRRSLAHAIGLGRKSGGRKPKAAARSAEKAPRASEKAAPRTAEKAAARTSEAPKARRGRPRKVPAPAE